MKREGPYLALAMLLPVGLGYTYFVAMGGGGAENQALRIAYPISKAIQFSLPLAFIGCFGRASRPKSRLRFAAAIGILFGIATGSLIICIAQELRDTVLAETPIRVKTKVAEFHVPTPGTFVMLACFLSLIHSFLEEYYWRWFVYVRLRQFWSFFPAAMLSGLAFMGHHIFVLNEYLPGRFWSATVPFGLCIAVGGAFWAWLYEKSGSLLGPWISHALIDAAIMFVGFRMVFGPD